MRMTITPAAALPTPWYREPWPWLLMAGPVSAVVAGIFTIWLAISHEDGLVADDYYKQGLAINKMIGREAEAARLGLQARVHFTGDGVRLHLTGAAPQALTLQMVHPTRAGLDRLVVLPAEAGGWYAGHVPVPAAGRWHILIEDGTGAWRISGEWEPGSSGSPLVLDAMHPDGARR